MNPNRIPIALRVSSLLLLLAMGLSAQTIGDPSGRTGLFPLLATPPGNPFESSPSDPYKPLAGSLTELKVWLGMALFSDEQLSSNNTMSCLTCHAFESGGLDPRPAGLAPNNGFGSLGVLPMDAQGNYMAGTPVDQQRQVTPLMAPTMINAAFASRLFWDTRSGPAFPMSLSQASLFLSNAALEAQAVEPPISNIEMAHSGLLWGAAGTPGSLEDKLNDSKVLALATFSTIPPPLQPFVAGGVTYAEFFDAVFNMPGSIFPGVLGTTRERFASALAAYERTLVSNQAPIDVRSLRQDEQAGFNHLLSSGCFSCHSSSGTPTLTGTGGFQNAMDALLTDNLRHGNIGFPSPAGATGVALGSFGVKTPSLRNVLLRPRWGHNGVFTSFSDLLSFYNGTLPGTSAVFSFNSGSGPGGRLDDIELAEVMAFFEALTDPRLVPSTPGAQLSEPFWHPDMYSDRHPFNSTESALHPGTPAPGGTTPDIILHVPALSGDSHFNVGVREAPANSSIAVVGVTASGLSAVPTPPFMLNPNGLLTFNMPVNPATGTVTDAQGFGTMHFPPLPVLPGGIPISFQIVVLDPVSNQLAWSNAGTVLIQP